MNIKCNEDIILRSILESDTENVLRWRNSEFVKKNFNYQKEITEEDHKNWLLSKVDTGLVHQFIIFDVQLKKDIGSVYIKDVDRINNRAEYGVFLGEREVIGKGIGTTVTRAMIQYAFEDLRLHRLYLQVHKGNSGAIKCYEKAGFLREAILKDHVYVNGGYSDLLIMGIINDIV